MSAEATWPIETDALVESVTTTTQPDGSWAVAALGIRPAEDGRTARTWGRTRTSRNLSRTGRAHVQFVTDPVVFARAALEPWSRDEPLLPEAAACVEVEATRIETGRDGGTAWTDWSLRPVRSEVRERAVPAPSRGVAAVIEMTIAASRLDVRAYDSDRLHERLSYHAEVARRCGGTAEREAAELIEGYVDEGVPTGREG